MYTTIRHELSHARKAWPGKLIDQCLLSALDREGGGEGALDLCSCVCWGGGLGRWICRYCVLGPNEDAAGAHTKNCLKINWQARHNLENILNGGLSVPLGRNNYRVPLMQQSRLPRESCFVFLRVRWLKKRDCVTRSQRMIIIQYMQSLLLIVSFTIYFENHSVCALVRIGTPSPLACVYPPPPRNQRGGGDWRKSLCLLCVIRYRKKNIFK